jgi:hypothetical protein
MVIERCRAAFVIEVFPGAETCCDRTWVVFREGRRCVRGSFVERAYESLQSLSVNFSRFS